MKVGNHYNQSSEQDYVNAIARHLQKLRVVKLVRDPISVGIDPVRELEAVFCGVSIRDNKVASNIVSVRDKSLQSSRHNQESEEQQGNVLHGFARHLPKSR